MNMLSKRVNFEDLFDNFLVSGAENLKCDLYEKGNNYIVEADAPGFKKENIKIETDEGYLIITIAKEDEKEEEDKNYLRHERYSNFYKRQFYLGNMDEDNIKAEFKDGTLKITVPKTEEIQTKKQIEIK